MHDIDDKIKSLYRAQVWTSVWLLVLCLGLIVGTTYIWEQLLLNEQRYLAIVAILKSKGIL